MIRHISLALLCALPFCGNALAQDDDLFGSDSRMRVLEYNKNDIYTIFTRYGYQTYIEFSEQETIETISVGDRSMWQIIPSRNRLFIRPMVNNVTTNMAVITNRRSYQFDIKSLSDKAGDADLVIYVARFHYPDERPPMQAYAPTVAAAPVAPVAVQDVQEPPAVSKPIPSAAQPPAPEAPLNTSPAPLRNNYFYTFSGNDEDAPVEVFDDGRSTFLRFADMTRQIPKIFVLEPDGTETQVPFVLRDGYAVIGTVSGRIALKGDRPTVYIYNELLAPGSAT